MSRRMNKLERYIWQRNIFFYQTLLYWRNERRLQKVARYLRRKKMYPVNLTEKLLDVWEFPTYQGRRESHLTWTARDRWNDFKKSVNNYLVKKGYKKGEMKKYMENKFKDNPQDMPEWVKYII